VLTLATAGQAIFVANGGVDDLTGAALALAQNKPAEAVRLAQQEWQRRQFSDVADVLATALHAAGRDTEALPYAKKATGLSASNAKYAYHQGVVELALGDRTAARTDISRALALNPYFSPIDAPAARRYLTALGTS
jgi:tetratricopeptide (TPR) repeat protein